MGHQCTWWDSLMVHEGLYIFMCYSSGPQVGHWCTEGKCIADPFVDHSLQTHLWTTPQVRKWVIGARSANGSRVHGACLR